MDGISSFLYGGRNENSSSSSLEPHDFLFGDVSEMAKSRGNTVTASITGVGCYHAQVPILPPPAKANRSPATTPSRLHYTPPTFFDCCLEDCMFPYNVSLLLFVTSLGRI